MSACGLRLLSVPVWLLFAASALAGAPELREDCRDSNGDPIPLRASPSQRAFAEARLIRGSSPRGGSSFFISINPERTYLGRQTQQWLYYRQCAHIVERPRAVELGERALNIRDEEQADCWAARKMLEIGASQTSLYSIERDLERVALDRRWGEVLPGPQRRVVLSRCGQP